MLCGQRQSHTRLELATSGMVLASVDNMSLEVLGSVVYHLDSTLSLTLFETMGFYCTGTVDTVCSNCTQLTTLHVSLDTTITLKGIKSFIEYRLKITII